MVADAQLQAQQRAQELAEQEAGTPEVPQTTPPDGATALRAQQEAAAAARQQALEASRAVQEPDDEILQSTGQAEPVRPSEAMGLRADAGGLGSVAAMAVDAGLTEQLQAEASAQQTVAQQKQEQSAQDQQGINAETGEVSDAAREQQIRVRLDFLGQQGRAQADALQERGNAAAQLAAKHKLAALRRKKTDEMSTEELQALAADLSPRHVRAKRLQQAIAEREAYPSIHDRLNL